MLYGLFPVGWIVLKIIFLYRLGGRRPHNLDAMEVTRSGWVVNQVQASQRASTMAS